LNWLDNKVNQFQTFQILLKKLSVKQLVETTIQQVDFPLSLQNISVSKELESSNLGL